MTNIISKDIFTKGMKRLEVAFMKNISQDTIKLYYEKLNKNAESSFDETIEYIIDNDNFFPSIARFKQCFLSEPTNFQPPIEDVFS